MMRPISGSYYEKHCNGFTLTEICEMSGVTDKSLSEWFKRFDAQYAQASTLDLKTVHRKNADLRSVFQQKEMELFLLQNEWDIAGYICCPRCPKGFAISQRPRRAVHRSSISKPAA